MNNCTTCGDSIDSYSKSEFCGDPDCEWISEVRKQQKELETLRARERVLSMALEQLLPLWWEYEDGNGWPTKDIGLKTRAEEALSTVPEHTRKTWELERAVIEKANKAHNCTCIKANGYCEHELSLFQDVEALQAHKEKMDNA